VTLREPEREDLLATIDVAQAQVGMVLSADIVDKRGRLLIPAGKELSQKHLGALPAWGVNRIEVEGDEVEAIPGSEVEPWAVEEATAAIDVLFTHVNRAHPMMEALSAVCIDRKAVHIQADHDRDAA
jgi:hypothetical protein